MSNNLNLVMRFLAAMTIILAIPTVISSFFGMNVEVPMSENPLAFLDICILAVFLAGICATVLWRKNMF